MPTVTGYLAETTQQCDSGAYKEDYVVRLWGLDQLLWEVDVLDPRSLSLEVDEQSVGICVAYDSRDVTYTFDVLEQEDALRTKSPCLT